ncbi:restriction endonuclease subunit S [Basilea psittacipulmonis]|uniref:restriction endonuclease subunit S n=1 Tax=Basilea psittacipulmonis TaxID=1472345 RepID=UPI0006911D2E|nr:restriction endonuclease subunit S [Basilea psittacipulmonis]
MGATNFQAAFLHFVDFSQLTNWSVSHLLKNEISYNHNFQLVPLNKILKRNKTAIQVTDNKKYKRITIKMNNGGVFVRDEVLGKEIGTKNQFLVKEKQFVLSKIDARNGAFGIVKKDTSNAIITGNFWAYDVDYSLIEPVYLELITTTKQFIKFCQQSSVGTTNRHYLQEDLFLVEKIPLPDINTQKALVQTYQDKIAKADELEKQANQIDSDIEKYLFEELGIEIHQTERAETGKLRFVNFRELNLWGVASQDAITAETIFISKQFKNEPITNFFEINPTTKIPNNQIISFIPMTNISDIYGEITVHDKQILKPNYTKFKENDLIWAKITPCMENGKSAIATNLENGFGFGSTEFHVLRAKNNDFSIHLLHILLRTKHLRRIATQYFTGSAGQQRVPKLFLEKLTLPILNLEIQTQIVTHIQTQKQQQKSHLTTATALRWDALAEFEQAIFHA